MTLRIGRPRGKAEITLRNNACLTFSGDLALTIEQTGSLTLLATSAVSGYGSGNAVVYGQLAIAEQSYFGFFGSHTGDVLIASNAHLFLRDEGTLHRTQVTVEGTFSSRGGYLEGGSFMFRPNATHQTWLGQTTMLLPWGGMTPNITLDGILNVFSNQNISTTGTVVPLWSAPAGAHVSGQYRTLLLNGQTQNNTYSIVFATTGNNSSVTVNLVFS